MKPEINTLFINTHKACRVFCTVSLFKQHWHYPVCRSPIKMLLTFAIYFYFVVPFKEQILHYLFWFFLCLSIYKTRVCKLFYVVNLLFDNVKNNLIHWPWFKRKFGLLRCEITQLFLWQKKANYVLLLFWNVDKYVWFYLHKFSILIQCQPRCTIYIYGLKQSITIYHKIFVKLHLYLNASKFASLSDAL